LATKLSDQVLSIQSAKRLLKGESVEKRYRELEKYQRPVSPWRILEEKIPVRVSPQRDMERFHPFG
jgi:hypothetical protein